MSFVITQSSISFVHNAETYFVSAEENKELYNDVLACIRSNDLERAAVLVSPRAKINALSEEFAVLDGKLVLTHAGTKYTLPTELSDTILLYLDERLPTQSLVEFSKKLVLNPSFRAVNQLFSFIKAGNFTICEDGDFIAYKAVSEDFKDLHTRTFDNSVGQIVEIPRNQVDEDPKECCSYGLHVATHEYAYSFNSAKNVVLVKVNPRDVVSVPIDYNFSKMRVCRYEVLDISKGELKEKIFKSTKDSDNCDGCTCDSCDRDDCDYCDDCEDCDCEDEKYPDDKYPDEEYNEDDLGCCYYCTITDDCPFGNKPPLWNSTLECPDCCHSNLSKESPSDDEPDTLDRVGVASEVMPEVAPEGTSKEATPEEAIMDPDISITTYLPSEEAPDTNPELVSLRQEVGEEMPPKCAECGKLVDDCECWNQF